jgi:ribonuclease HI
MTINKYNVFTDGSCLNNGKKNSTGAIGIFFSDDDPDNCGQAIENDGNKITNQTMELIACIQAFRIIDQKIINGLKIKIIYIYTDSTYIINCINKWYTQWEKNQWKTSKGKDVENKDLIKALYELKNKYIVIFKHIRSHKDPPDIYSEEYKFWYGNYMADKLATEASREYLIIKEIDKKEKEDKEIQNLLNDQNNQEDNLDQIDQIDQLNKNNEYLNTVVKKVKSSKKINKKIVKNALNV